MKTDTIDLIKPADLAKLWQSNPELAVIDVRTAGEYESVHAKGAKLAPLHDLDERRLIGALQSPEQPVYILCKSGIRATQAAEKLIASGLASPVVVEGGTDAWVAAGLPVERHGRGVLPLNRQMQCIIGTFTFVGSVLAMAFDPRFVWLPMFMGAGLIFAGLSGLCPMMHLVARMPWNRASAGSSCSKD
ncbi:MAG: rhodanese-like domain-containing protein [Chthoniobacterales bacterium]